MKLPPGGSGVVTKCSREDLDCIVTTIITSIVVPGSTVQYGNCSIVERTNKKGSLCVLF